MSEHCPGCDTKRAIWDVPCPGLVYHEYVEKDAEIAALKAKLESAEEYAYKLNCRIARANGDEVMDEKKAMEPIYATNDKWRTQGGKCIYSGPGRGDCEHFLGLPSPERQTTDEYGKPHDWCWPCWKMHLLNDARATIATLTSERDSWKETARLYAGNSDFWRSENSKHLTEREACSVEIVNRVKKFIDWHQSTPNDGLIRDSRIAYDAQTRVLRALEYYLTGKDEYLNACCDLVQRSKNASFKIKE